MKEIQKSIDPVTMEKVREYTIKNYPRTFGAAKSLIITEHSNHFRVKTNKDASPLILGLSVAK